MCIRDRHSICTGVNLVREALVECDVSAYLVGFYVLHVAEQTLVARVTGTNDNQLYTGFNQSADDPVDQIQTLLVGQTGCLLYTSRCV